MQTATACNIARDDKEDKIVELKSQVERKKACQLGIKQDQAPSTLKF